ncbi:MAG: MBL fold metallo-hydrolase [Candidatus Poribacteria bacterium]|nr:MBL fold metallo-hydrolase [Candidatus Poribacteria bacterium]
MLDYFEIDFLNVESKKSGDAIPLWYSAGGVTRIHVVDGGFQDTGDKVVEHIKKYYGYPRRIDAVIVSHPDGDHSGGLRTVLEDFEVSTLWMLRPWLYANELIDRFSRFSNVYNLVHRLKDIYPNIAALEKIANAKGIPIYAPFQGTQIGEFTVLAPTKQRYLDLVVASEKTPEATKELIEHFLKREQNLFQRAALHAVSFIRSLWGEEIFSPEETSSENEMSIVQYANLCGKRILLTADAGRGTLIEAANYARKVLPGIDFFQVPHHGSRRNVSTDILDFLLGKRLPRKLEEGSEKFTAIISASKGDKDHPRKAVVRACIHRGAKVISNQDGNKYVFHNRSLRAGWTTPSGLPYPEDQEKD